MISSDVACDLLLVDRQRFAASHTSLCCPPNSQEVPFWAGVRVFGPYEMGSRIASQATAEPAGKPHQGDLSRSDRFPSIVATTTGILRRCGTSRSIHSTGSDLHSHNCLLKHPDRVCSVDRSCSAPYPHNSLHREAAFSHRLRKSIKCHHRRGR